ncbi:MAG: hypothetical protein ACAH59_12970 [Pseudobdellovibrionaceae bacterium]
MATLANGSSYLARTFWPWISPYGNAIGLTVNWNFFAPDPAHTMYIHYYAHFDEENADPVEGYIPPEKEKIVVDTSQRRFLYAMRFLILDERRMKILLGPYLCRIHSGAASIHIENILEPIPNLDISHLTEMGERREAKMMEYTHVCGEEPDEMAL